MRPLLFRVDAERIHELSLASLGVAAPLMARLAGPPRARGRLEQRLLGLGFPNPIGLAAGFDKRARAAPAWPALGFGFAEVGTVTAHGQPGNPRPRVYRLPADRAIVNRLGFNNPGARATAERLARWQRRRLLGRAPLGVNLGKSKVTAPDAAPGDYADSLELLWRYADYVTVNVSSPNTPGLRDLQAAGPLAEILDAIAAVNERLARAHAMAPRPVLVKLAPDLAPDQVDAAVDLARERGAAGVIVSNTTIAREGLSSPRELTSQAGGLSGAPLRDRATEMVRRVALRAAGRPRGRRGRRRLHRRRRLGEAGGGRLAGAAVHRLRLRRAVHRPLDRRGPGGAHGPRGRGPRLRDRRQRPGDAPVASRAGR